MTKHLQIYHAEVGVFCETIQLRDRLNFTSDNEANSCPVTGIFHKYPTSTWYICIITLPVFLIFTYKKKKKNTIIFYYYFKSQTLS